jgi:hypothetical protein
VADGAAAVCSWCGLTRTCMFPPGQRYPGGAVTFDSVAGEKSSSAADASASWLSVCGGRTGGRDEGGPADSPPVCAARPESGTTGCVSGRLVVSHGADRLSVAYDSVSFTRPGSSCDHHAVLSLPAGPLISPVGYTRGVLRSLGHAQCAHSPAAGCDCHMEKEVASGGPQCL